MRKTFNLSLSYWPKLTDLLLPNRNQNQQSKEITEDVQSQPISNLHYSIPGKAFTEPINKGHILKTEDKWPLTGS